MNRIPNTSVPSDNTPLEREEPAPTEGVEPALEHIADSKRAEYHESTGVEPVSEVDLKVCITCGIARPISEYSIDRRFRTHHPRPRCKPCVAQHFRGYYQLNKASVLKKNRSYREANWERTKELTYKRIKSEPHKHKARAAVNNAVNAGRFKKQPCKNCGNTKTDFHHTNGYDKANWFVGLWLCRQHHAAVHKQLREELIYARQYQ